MSVPVDPTVLALISGASTAAVIGLLGAWIQSRREHSKWLRERRFEAYRDFMVDMDAFRRLRSQPATVVTIRKLKRQHEQFAATFPGSFEAVSLLGPRRVNAEGQSWLEVFEVANASSSEIDAADFAASRWAFLVAAGRTLRSKNVGQSVPPNSGRTGFRQRRRLTPADTDHPISSP